MEEAHGDVEGGAAPVLHGVERGEVVGDEGRDLEEVARADAGGQEGLVRVAEGRVGQEGAARLADALGEGLGALAQEHLPQAGRRGDP